MTSDVRKSSSSIREGKLVKTWHLTLKHVLPVTEILGNIKDCYVFEHDTQLCHLYCCFLKLENYFIPNLKHQSRFIKEYNSKKANENSSKSSEIYEHLATASHYFV